MTARCTVAFLLLVFVLGNPAKGQQKRPGFGRQIAVQPSGEYAKIDTRGTIDVMRRLGSSNKAVKMKAIKDVKTSPNKFSPPVLYALSNEMFRTGQKDGALFWFYLGQLRGAATRTSVMMSAHRRLLTC